MSTPLKRFFWLVLLSLLTACGPTAPALTPTATVDLQAVYEQTLATTVAKLTQTAAPRPTPTLRPGQSPFFSMKGYTALFAKDGSLFLKVGENPAVSLTGTDTSGFIMERMLSDDGQKIIFLRGKTSKSGSAHADVYTINADGTNLRLLLPPEWLATLPKGTGRGAALPVFVPGTHRVLFETSLCQSPADDAPCSIGLFSADADNGEIKTFLSPGKAQGANPQASFTVSPDGKLIAVASVGHVDILDVDGQLVRGGIFLYTPSTAETLYAKIFWLPDSSGLIAALPTNTYHISAYNKDVSSYAIWRYTLADSAAEAIPVDPSPMNLLGEADKFLVSPDGRWLLYGGNGPSESSIYLADLSNGHVQPLTDNPQPGFSWSPDSQRFFGQNFAGVIGERVAQVSKKSFEVLRWMDATHFICRFCGQDDTKPYVAEIAGDELVLYRLPPAMEDDAYLLILPQNKSRE